MAAAGDDEAPKKKRARLVQNVKPTVMNRFRGVDAATVTKVTVVSDINCALSIRV